MSRQVEVGTLPEAFIRTARAHPRRFCMTDSSTRRRHSFGETLARAVALARAMGPRWRGEELVGLCLPPSTGGALANLAALLAGRVPVNLNYTASQETIASILRQCGIRITLTSRVFLARTKLAIPGEAVFLEDVMPAISGASRLAAWGAARFLPASRLPGYCGADRTPTGEDLATVIFSSGSTGEPKGVMLTHANIMANLQALKQLFAPGETDVVLGILPFFHSFGFTVTLWMPLVAGCGAAFHANPLEARSIGELARECRATFLMATPTFLQAMTRRCEPGDFANMKHVLVGAQKLPDRIADAFRERFGVEADEGYGCTECSPIVAVNVANSAEPGSGRVGRKRGSVGRAIPGVAVKVVNAESGEPVPPGEAGLLLVQGPNVMKGYLGEPEKTAEVMHDGWYATGDLARVDEDGFIWITDRLSRFSKIGGEMVPHGRVEESLHAAAGATEQVFCVTGAPDPVKGEKLVVLHTWPEEKLDEVLARMAAAGLPNLWLPKKSAFVKVAAIPFLGTGKVDLRRARELARSASGSGNRADSREHSAVSSPGGAPRPGACAPGQ